MGDDMVTAAQAAQRFGVTSNTVVRWIKQGHLRGRRKGPGHTSGWLIPESEVRRLEAQLAGNNGFSTEQPGPAEAGGEDES